MASRKAKQFLASMGLGINKPHTALELANFCAGTGHGRYPMPYHVIRFRETTGDSKKTVGWAATLSDARTQANAMRDANGVENARSEYGYYIRDIRNGRIFRP